MLMRFDPFREMDDLLRSWNGARTTLMPMDAYRRGDTFHVEIDLPGVDADSIELTVERDVLQIRARRVAEFGEDDTVLVHERPTGEVTRQLFLGKGLDTERIEASYEGGVLMIRLPVAEEAKPHRIAIGNGQPKEVDANIGDRKEVSASSGDRAEVAT